MIGTDPQTADRLLRALAKADLIERVLALESRLGAIEQLIADARAAHARELEVPSDEVEDLGPPEIHDDAEEIPAPLTAPAPAAPALDSSPADAGEKK